MLRNTCCYAQDGPTTKNGLTQDVSCAKFAKPCFRKMNRQYIVEAILHKHYLSQLARTRGEGVGSFAHGEEGCTRGGCGLASRGLTAPGKQELAPGSMPLGLARIASVGSR